MSAEKRDGKEGHEIEDDRRTGTGGRKGKDEAGYWSGLSRQSYDAAV
jgi:hypothetical protein